MEERWTMATVRSTERGRIAGLLLERTDRLEFQSLLDVGCGCGELLKLILEEHSEIRACGIDLSERKITNAEVKLGEQAELTVGDAENLPYPDGSFDLVICGNSIRRCLNPVKAVNQFYRVLKKGGTLILFGCGRQSAKFVLAKVVSRYGRPTGRLRYTPKEIREYMECSAFHGIGWDVPFKNVYIATGIK